MVLSIPYIFFDYKGILNTIKGGNPMTPTSLTVFVVLGCITFYKFVVKPIWKSL